MEKPVSSESDFRTAHGYVVNDLWYPRVTSIVSIKSKPALYRFYGELGSFAEGEAIKQRSADEGTLIHDTLEKILTGKEVDIDPLIEPSVEAAVKFIRDKNIQID